MVEMADNAACRGFLLWWWRPPQYLLRCGGGDGKPSLQYKSTNKRIFPNEHGNLVVGGVRTDLENLHVTTEQQTNTAQNFPGARCARRLHPATMPATNCTCPQFVPLSRRRVRLCAAPAGADERACRRRPNLPELPYNRRLCEWVQIRCKSGAREDVGL